MVRAFAIVVAVLVVTGCKTVPDVDDVLESEAARPVVADSHGPLPDVRRTAVLDRLTQEGGNTDVLARHLAIEQAVARNPLVVGNRVRIVRDGEDTFRAMFQAIRAARKHVNLEFYIFEDVQIDGASLRDLLIKKQHQGVEVNIIYDSVGSIATPREFFTSLTDAGISMVEFNPINPLVARTGYSLNDRDHRKILIVDGRTAIVGGINLSKEYETTKLRALAGSNGGAESYWRDTDLIIEGPAVAEIQRLFLDHWGEQKGPPIAVPDAYPTVANRGNDVIRILGSQGNDAVPRYYATLLSAMRAAEKNIWITAAYFVPTEREIEALIDAANRGVDVRLLLPGKSDSAMTLGVGRSHYSELLKAGVNIFEMQDAILHSKTATIDGVWSSIGSSNFDHRSVLFNDEIDAIVLGRDTASQVEKMFLADLATARQIDRKEWADRPFMQRIGEFMSRTWQTLL
jgi:cardiolipin synthase